MKNKKVAILVEDQYQDLELWYPALRLSEAGAVVHFIGRSKGHQHLGKYGYPAVSDVGFSEAKASDYDALVIPGGFAPDFMRRSPDPARLTREIFNQGKPVAAICHGAWILASAGVLKGRKVTCFHAIKDDVVHAGAQYEDRSMDQRGCLSPWPRIVSFLISGLPPGLL